MGVWLEIVTLLIPGFNDSADELHRLTDFVASVSPDIPWHVTAFHKDYRMNDPDNTTPEMLLRAVEIGRSHGLRYVYAGNLPGRVGDFENTRCPTCRALLVERHGYLIRSYRLTADGSCPDCGTSDPGPMGHRDSPDRSRRCRFFPGRGGCGSCRKGYTRTPGRAYFSIPSRRVLNSENG